MALNAAESGELLRIGLPRLAEYWIAVGGTDSSGGRRLRGGDAAGSHDWSANAASLTSPGTRSR